MTQRRYFTDRVCVTCGETKRVTVHCKGAAPSEHCPPCGQANRVKAIDVDATEIDHVVVLRLIAGVPVQSTKAERLAAMQALPARLPATRVAARFGVHYRTIERYRAELRNAS